MGPVMIRTIIIGAELSFVMGGRWTHDATRSTGADQGRCVIFWRRSGRALLLFLWEAVLAGVRGEPSPKKKKSGSPPPVPKKKTENTSPTSPHPSISLGALSLSKK